jgi:hypothetical protein
VSLFTKKLVRAIKRAPVSLFSVALIAGCAPLKPGGLDSTPDLSGYSRFELFSQAAVASGQLQAEGTLKYKLNPSHFEVHIPSIGLIGRMHVQADACRDDPSPECQRRFVVTGRINALGSTMNCSVPIRNDSTVGYTRQTLSGICQNQYGRAYTLNLYSK